MLTSIVIDATHLETSTPTGIEMYTLQLLPALSRQLIARNVGVSWVGHSHQKPNCAPEGVQWLHSAHHSLWSQAALPGLLNALEPDLFFTPSGIPPLRYSGKVALTVHDMAAYIVPEAFSRSDRLLLRSFMGRVAKKAVSIIAPSRYTKALIERFWQIPSERITVVAHGPVSLDEATELVPGCENTGLLVYIGRIETKKNLLPVIAGFAKYATEQPGQLVLAGSKGIGAAKVLKAIAVLPSEVRSRIVMPGYISDRQKRWLLEHAQTVLVPCPVEGFGFPILEGFAAGVPIICAQAGALPEVAGNAVLYAQSDIGTDWYLQMLALLESDVARRLVILGQKRYETFNWQSTAEQTAIALCAPFE